MAKYMLGTTKDCVLRAPAGHFQGNTFSFPALFQTNGYVYRCLLIFALCLFAFSCGKGQTLAVPKGAAYKNSSLPVSERVADLIGRMTLNEKIGQMIQVERSVCDHPEVFTKYWLGSVLSGGGSAPYPNSPKAWSEMYDRFQSYALATRLGIPILYGIDAVHGNNTLIGGVVFPHNIGMGATFDPAIVEAAAHITAAEIAGAGLDWTFAPCIAAPQDERWGRTYEGYSEQTALVATMGAAATRGFQGQSLGAGAPGILACAKHFAGDGGTFGGKDQGDTKLDDATFRRIHIAQYKSVIDAGAGSVMISFSSINGENMHGNKHLITDVLKGELGFRGFVISDWMGINHLDPSFTECVKKSVNAGIDMIMVPFEYEKCFLAMKALVEKNEIPADRIDDAVKRILSVKLALGKFEHPYSNKDFAKDVGSGAHREVARKAVRESAVLLKNRNALLPLRKNIQRLLVCGKCANDIGIQCGGWTITWQGNLGDITTGTTIFDGIRNAVSKSTAVIYSEDGSAPGSFDAAIAVVGEYPYAEFYGDKESLALSSVDIDRIRSIRARGIPVIVILVSGRPLIVTDQIGSWDALLAAWLPGTEGEGIADVIFGDYKPTGKLPYTWPKNMKQIPINVGDEQYDPLFSFGYGLTY
jgi:beta-glucosidase